MKPVPFTHSFPETGADAIAKLAHDDTKVIAGGQSLGPMMNLRLARPGNLIDLTAIPVMKDIRIDGDSLLIGAGVTHARIEDGDTPVALPPMMRSVAANIAYRAVRNRGTIGGSLAHADPAADWVSTMTALDAQLHLLGADGARRVVAMSGFMDSAYRTALTANEIIEVIAIPAHRGTALWGYYKVCRKVGEFADAIGAVVIDPKHHYARVVVGATGGAPLILDDLADDLAQTAQIPATDRIEQALTQRLPNLDRIKLRLLATATKRAIEKVFSK